MVTSDDILGKKAVDSAGEILGTVVKLHIDDQAKSILGITVDQGFLKPELYIGIEYVNKFGVDAILLNKPPLDKILGLQVYTISGKYVGIVSSFGTKGHELKTIEIRKGFNSARFRIGIKDIKEIGGSIIVKNGFERVK
jgi:sporulation protein YlmC with PRC-barrel domain